MKVFFLLFSLLLFSTSIYAKEIVLTKDNTVVLNDAFTDESISKLISDIRQLDSQLKSGYPIYLFLDTPGGSIQAGVELIEFTKGINRPIHTITSKAASMGFQTVQHLGKRYILEYGILMSHKASGGFRGEFGGGGSQLDSRYSLWLRRLNEMDLKTVERTNGKKTLKKYQAEYDNELWLNGKEAVKNGYADEVVTVKCDATLQGQRVQKVSRPFGLSVELSFSACPLVSAPLGMSLKIRTNKGLMDLEAFLDNGGLFAEECKSEQKVDVWGNPVVNSTSDRLCATDRRLTLEKTEQVIEEFKNTNSSKSNKVIRMSFGNFIAE